MDHVGLEKLISEVTMYVSGTAASLPAPILYRDFIGHTLHWQSTTDSEAYFSSLLAEFEEPTYPFGLSNVLGDGSAIEESNILLSKELTDEISGVCLNLGITPAVLFHAAYSIVIDRCSNTEHAIFGFF